VGDEAKTPISINRRKLATRVTSFTEDFSEKYEAIKSHKIAMHRATSYGVQRGDASLKHHATDSSRDRLMRSIIFTAAKDSPEIL
jgi:hypothetical protein